jgi:hypothetical protein
MSEGLLSEPRPVIGSSVFVQQHNLQTVSSIREISWCFMKALQNVEWVYVAREFKTILQLILV